MEIRKFSTRVQAVVIIVSAITLILYNVMCYSSAKKILREDFFSRSDVVMKQMNEKVMDYIDEFAINMDLIAENEIICKSLKTGDYDWNILPMMQSLIAMDRYIINVEIYDKNLETRYKATDVLAIPLSNEIRKAFKDIEYMVSDYKTVLTPNNDTYILSVVRKICVDKECVGYAVAYLDHKEIIKAYNNAEVFIESDDIFFVDSLQKIASAETGELLDASYSYKTLKLTGEDANRFKGDERYEARIDSISMSILTFVSPKHILRQLKQIAYTNAGISALIFVLCILGTLKLGKSISEPIQDVKQYIEKNITDK